MDRQEQESRAVHCQAGKTALRLTLTSKLLEKSFADAVLTPFVRAFNRKNGTTWALGDVASVMVNRVVLSDRNLRVAHLVPAVK